jgi:thioredoxin-related protein
VITRRAVEFRDGGSLVKRIFLLAAFVALMVVPQASAATNTWIKTFAEAQKKARAGNQLIFVDLFADWCGWCHRMEQEVFPSQAFQDATDKMVLLRLNTEDGKEGTEIARQFQATSLPMFLVLTGDRELAGVIRGYQPAGVFVKMLGDEEKKYREFQERVKNDSSVAEPQKRLDVAKEMRSRFSLEKSEQRLSKLTSERGVPPTIRDEAFYELAVTQWMQKKYDDSMKTLNRFAGVQKSGEFFERSRLLVSDIYIGQGKWGAAADNLRSFKKSYPQSKYASNVDYILPQLEQQMKLAGGKK